jgi:Domain of unknown function (DUF305)
MHFFMKRRLLATIAAFSTAALITILHASLGAATLETPFLAENRTAMDKMMADMTVKPSGDVDQDFAAMMIPHHQGAIDMAKAELRYGRNEQLRRIAQEIVVDQQQEIVAMHLALGQPLPVSDAAPTQPTGAAKPMQMPMTNMKKEP